MKRSQLLFGLGYAKALVPVIRSINRAERSSAACDAAMCSRRYVLRLLCDPPLREAFKRWPQPFSLRGASSDRTQLWKRSGAQSSQRSAPCPKERPPTCHLARDRRYASSRSCATSTRPIGVQPRLSASSRSASSAWRSRSARDLCADRDRADSGYELRSTLPKSVKPTNSKSFRTFGWAFRSVSRPVPSASKMMSRLWTPEESTKVTSDRSRTRFLPAKDGRWNDSSKIVRVRTSSSPARTNVWSLPLRETTNPRPSTYPTSYGQGTAGTMRGPRARICRPPVQMSSLGGISPLEATLRGRL
jgi:hypothetical protein